MFIKWEGKRDIHSPPPSNSSRSGSHTMHTSTLDLIVSADTTSM